MNKIKKRFTAILIIIIILLTLIAVISEFINKLHGLPFLILMLTVYMIILFIQWLIFK